MATTFRLNTGFDDVPLAAGNFPDAMQKFHEGLSPLLKPIAHVAFSAMLEGISGFPQQRKYLAHGYANDGPLFDRDGWPNPDLERAITGGIYPNTDAEYLPASGLFMAAALAQIDTLFSLPGTKDTISPEGQLIGRQATLPVTLSNRDRVGRILNMSPVSNLSARLSVPPTNEKEVPIPAELTLAAGNLPPEEIENQFYQGIHTTIRTSHNTESNTVGASVLSKELDNGRVSLLPSRSTLILGNFAAALAHVLNDRP